MRINRSVRSVSVSSIRIADPFIAAANTIAMMMLAYIALFEVILFRLVVDYAYLLLIPPVRTGDNRWYLLFTLSVCPENLCADLSCRSTLETHNRFSG